MRVTAREVKPSRQLQRCPSIDTSMGKLNTNYGSYCYQSGTMLDRAVTKYCTHRNDYSGSPPRNDTDDETSLQLGRLICCRGIRPMRYGDDQDDNEEEQQSDYHELVEKCDEYRFISSDETDRDEQDGGHVEVIDESRLAYRAEGNANIVLSLMDDHRVLRLRKTAISYPDGKGNVDLERIVKYSRVIASRFSRRFVLQPKLGRLDTYDLEAFNKKLAKFRPVNRLDKEIRMRDCILYPDVAFLPLKLDPLTFRNQDYGQDGFRGHWQNTYCVEIKPKQGWSLDDICYNDGFTRDQLFGNWEGDQQLVDLKCTSKCRFCLFQYSKLHKKMIEKISKYCPSDLFSGKPIRMLNAIKGLIGSPQNNLKLCKNGRIVYDEQQDKSVFNRILKDIFPRDGCTKEERKTIFMNLIKEALLKDFSSFDTHPERKLLTLRKDRKKDKNLIHHRTCTSINYQFLPRNCVLKQILDMQLLVKPTLPTIRPDLYQQTSSGGNPFSYIDELYEKYLDCLDECCEQRLPVRSLCLEDSYLNDQERYQLGASALDCSIMITFRRLAEREEKRLSSAAKAHIVTLEKMKFLVNVTITDLDPKSLKHYNKYLRQLHESVAHYREFMTKLKR
ncbi:inositol-pentakisphosphate 2-kinase isoform X2 [Armigeres subalbatus]|uniref:inositol-pentakisphosphate 2-kinase isoform X2 n=1 Tax=Armigeres subalbatus TaxID=124917 RepID=UPI002ED33B32